MCRAQSARVSVKLSTALKRDAYKMVTMTDALKWVKSTSVHTEKHIVPKGVTALLDLRSLECLS